MTSRELLLIELVACVDAVWAPMRSPDWTSPYLSTNFYLARNDFPTLGIAWVAGGATAAQRLAKTRELDELQAAGLVIRSGSERKTRVILTDRGDELARRLAGLPCMDAALATLEEIARIGTPAVGGPSVCELELARLGDYENTVECHAELAIVEMMIAPALRRGWAVSDSSTGGCVWYCLTEAGAEALTGEHADFGDMPDEVSGGYVRYGKDYHAARKAIRTAAPDDTREIGFLPLSASHRRGWKETQSA